MSSDVILNPVGAFVPQNQPLTKPSYLVVFLEEKKTQKRFITIDNPEVINGFVRVKGVFSEMSADDIAKNYQQVLTSAPKDSILELMVPWSNISYIRSLVFRAK